ncbi:MAG: 4Fe-4S ferredoxin, partial [Deltaproteobacteria bacterium]|nr:4Fe-4S ferredoxin [Deltaproteobacteria bacterium]
MTFRDGMKKRGCLTLDELRSTPGCPTEERLRRGPVAVIECPQEIPCNPCEDACPYGAIVVGDPITNLPVLKEDLCRGCGLCIAPCPGLAIFLVDMTGENGEAKISFPFEYLPLPEPGAAVQAVDRQGQILAAGRVVGIHNSRRNDRTAVVTI